MRKLKNLKLIFILLIILGNTFYAQKSNVQIAGDYVQILIPVSAAASTFFKDDKSGRIEFIEAFATCLSATYLLKFTIKRERPDGSSSLSFPSGHTSSSFQAASFIHFRYGFEYAIPGYLAAAFVGYSRVYAKKHYTSDVLAGAALGILSSYVFTDKYEKVNIIPSIEGNSFGFNLSYKF
ncbi:MAG: phosphatase PAP2 family protein [Melioribacteraceae bacterium]|nr:phosphatase PAP2 family protein [Melioribacteraceae bacterium]